MNDFVEKRNELFVSKKINMNFCESCNVVSNCFPTFIIFFLRIANVMRDLLHSLFRVLQEIQDGSFKRQGNA